jgi:hypothetical protein
VQVVVVVVALTEQFRVLLEQVEQAVVAMVGMRQ